MSKRFFPFRGFLFLAFLLLGQSQVGFGQDYYDDGQREREGRVIEGVENVNGNGSGSRRTCGPNNNENEIENIETSPFFTAVSSLFFTPGTEYKVFFSVNPDGKNEPLHFRFLLMSNSDNSSILQSGNISLCPGESGQISTPLPREMPGNESIWRLFVWSFTEESQPDGYTYDAPHTLIQSSAANSSRQNELLTKVSLASIFIQTDKPVYKPEDLVRIRVITMGTDDLPHLTSGVNISIINSQEIIMKKWEQPLKLPEFASAPSNVSTNPNVALFGEFQKKINGLSSYEYQLSSEPPLGNWTIQVEAGSIRENMSFDVQKYILPKFQVKVHAPPVLYGTGEVTTTATIKVSYTFGKELEGTGTVNVTSGYDSRIKVQQIAVKDGEAKVQLSFTSSSSFETVHTITANVTEKNTGRWQIGKATVRIYPRETYTIEWINKPLKYKPGLPLTVQLKFTGQDGFPVKDVRPNSLRITFPPPLNPREMQSSIALNGIATFTFPTPLEKLPANSRFQVEYKRAKYDFVLPTAETSTSSGIFLEVVSPLDTVNFIQGNSYNFTIRSNKPIEPDLFHYLLWDDAEMEIHGAQTVVNELSKSGSEFPFSLQIPKGDYINLKIFVYFETDLDGTKHIISTSKSINTHNYLKIRVARPTVGKTLAPAPSSEINNSTKVDIGGAGINSTVAPLPDAPVESTTTSTTTTTEEPVYYVEYQSDGSGVAEEEEEEKEQQTKPEIGDELEVKPGDAVEIHFETYPDSTIAIRGIDQSLLLLTEQNQDNDLDPERVERQRRNPLSQKSHLDNMPTDNSSFLSTFRRLGVSVLTNERFEAYIRIGETGVRGDSEEGEMAASENGILDAPNIPQFDSRLRTEFPETWLWDEFQSSSNSSTTVLSKTLPDTLTSWIISGFSLNPRKGLGVASPATITGFMPFFVVLNFPYAVFKYESFDLQVIVHNYLDRDVNVFVTLFNRNNDFDFDFEDTASNRNNQTGNRTRSIKVKKNQAALVHFVITPLEFGQIPIEVAAVTDDGTAGDSMIRHLKVKPDGVRQERSQTIVFDPEGGDSNLIRTGSLNVNFPKGMVEGANSLQLTVVGEFMGSIVSALESSGSLDVNYLVRLPGGCASQNMAPFVSNMRAILYLYATNLQAPNAHSILQRARTNLQNGYQHELQYQYSDGSFASSDSLTAYVLRWFVAAQKYIYVDPNVISRAAHYVRRKQSSDGSFSSDIYTTAYTTLQFIQVNQGLSNDLDLKVAIQNGMRFISRQAVYDLDDNYVTNIVTATLMAGNHSEANHFFEKMERAANFTTNAQGVKVKYWDMKTKTQRATDPQAIEMTSYALLAHLWRKSTLDVSTIKINNWLLTQQNAHGGFISTQDTAIAHIALSEFALRPKVKFGDKLQLNIRASSSSSSRAKINSNSNDTEIALSLAPRNQMVLQEFKLPNSTKTLSVEARGSGPALIQMTETWYMPIRNRDTRSWRDHFNVTAKMSIPNLRAAPSETVLKLCVNSYHSSGAKDSMASIELPTGYVFSPEDYEPGSPFMAVRPGNAWKFEVKDGNTKLDVYFTEIKGYPPTCFSLAATQHFEVTNAKNPVIRVYEYDNPERKAEIFYEPAHNITECQLCRSTGACKKPGC